MVTSERGRIRVTVKRLRYEPAATSRRPQRGSEPAFAEPLSDQANSTPRYPKLKIVLLRMLALFRQRAAPQRFFA